MVVRIIVIVGLLIFGGFCIKMGVQSRPHKLKKKSVRISFKKNLPHELIEPKAILKSAKGELFGTVIWVLVLVGVIFMLINGYGNILYLIPCCLGIFYTVSFSSRKLLFYENAVVLQTLIGCKIYYLDEIDCIVSYNILNSFNRGVSYGYRLQQNGQVLTSFSKESFKEIDRIEEIYRNNPYVTEYLVQ